MAASQQWPPLDEVREWAERKLVTGQEPPSVTGKYKNLIALIDEILVSKSGTVEGEERSPESHPTP
jgi:hypothetical protein